MVSQKWHLLCILPTSVWPRIGPLLSVADPAMPPGQSQHSEPRLPRHLPVFVRSDCTPCEFSLWPRREASQRCRNESRSGTFFLVPLLLGRACQVLQVPPWTTLGRTPGSLAWVAVGAHQPGPRGLLPVSSFDSKVNPVTVAQDGSSVKGGSVTTLHRPFPPGSGRKLFGLFWRRQKLRHGEPMHHP